MKRAVLTLVILPFLLTARPAAAYEISHFRVKLEVGTDASVHVIETIHVNFGPERHHTICRALPLAIADLNGNHHPLGIKLIAVTDGAGKPWPLRLERSSRYLEVWMGSEEAFTTGEQIYELAYDVTGAVWSGPVRDELHWRVTGDAWDVILIGIEADVTIPEGASLEAVDAGSRVSRFGRVSREADVKMVDAEHARFVLTRGLLPGEGLEISVVWPAGLVRHPGVAARVARFASRNPALAAIPILGVALLLVLWRRTVVPREVGGPPPPGARLSVVEAAFLRGGERRPRHATALLIDLAERGALAIEELTATRLALIDLRRGSGGGQLAAPEDRFLDAVFAGRDRRTLTLPDASMGKAVKVLARDLEAALIEKGHLAPPLRSRRSPFLLAAIVVFVIGVVATYVARRATDGLAGMIVAADWVMAMGASCVAGFLVLGIGAARPRLTASGRRVVEWWRRAGEASAEEEHLPRDG